MCFLANVLTSSPPEEGIPTAPETITLFSDRLGGFLLHGAARLHRLSTGCNAVSPRQNVQSTDDIGVFRVTAFDTGEFFLRGPVFRTHVSTSRARTACIRGGTATSQPPFQASLYSNCRLNSNHPWSRMALFRPDLARTFLPGASMLPAADGHIPNLQVLDTHHRVVFADRGRGLVQVVAASIGDARMDALDSGRGFFQLLLNLTLRLIARWHRRRRASCFLKLLSGATNVPSLIVAKRAIPTSMPIALVAWGTGCSTSRSVWIETHHLPALKLTVALRSSPGTGRDSLSRIQPSLAGKCAHWAGRA